jgi:hypothetical protein
VTVEFCLPAAFGRGALRHAKEGRNDGLWLIYEKLEAAIKKGDATYFSFRGIALVEYIQNARHEAGLIEEVQSFEIEPSLGEISPVVMRDHEFSRVNPLYFIPKSLRFCS